MKKTGMITLFLLLSLLVGTSFAVEVTLFGPNEYLRTEGTPSVFTDTFPGINGEGKLMVKNGNEDGKDRISSAIIQVNGEEILGTKDFNQNVYQIEAPVNLEENNSISVELRSKPGGYLTVQVTQQIEAGNGSFSRPFLYCHWHINPCYRNCLYFRFQSNY